MPELPEVETIRRDLAPALRGARIESVRVAPDAGQVVQAPSPEALDAALRGRRIAEIRRRGKYLIFELDGGGALVVHLGMTGALLLRRVGDPPDPYTRVVFALDRGRELRFSDLRKFGRVRLVDDPEEVVGKLGPEPLDGLTAERLRAIFARRAAPVKAVLLDQEAIAGIGNIYADESLFRAGIHPLRPANSLRRAELERLAAAIPETLEEAMGHRGSSYRDYRDAEGREGTHQFYVRVFRRTGQPCFVCGAPIQRITLAGRGTHFCPRCQPAPRRRPTRGRTALARGRRAPVA
ncbi:MAG TPA: bifunctional DNA-formamidopyrimidine glycosylase/DNA-(apurinic or apyrimidinic site) lyase [Candidatus Tectomicrobia bacterium]|nr:bifunctional DNA-formamidopyrimidine glycosylase/DNA-(apurinic or apyrimidinic site) lyase [Candidatus Tectomicrobia bacterium]